MTRLVPPLDPLRLQTVSRARVLYADTDQMGFVYHGSYLRYLELARVELLREAGLSYRELEQRGLALPVTKLALRYLAPVRYDEWMQLQVGVVAFTRVQVHFQYRVVVDDQPRLTAQTRHCCMRLSSGRPQRFPEPVYSLLASRFCPG